MTATHRGTQPLRTRRLLLRRFTVDDAEAMFYTWAGDPQVTRYLSWDPHRDVEETRQLLEGWVGRYDRDLVYYNWAIELEGQLVGDIATQQHSLRYNHCEMGYCIGQAYWGRGIVTEALDAVLEELFERVGIHKIYARHNQHNPASGRVMQKCGMELEARLRDHYQFQDGSTADSLLYSILAENWSGRTA